MKIQDCVARVAKAANYTREQAQEVLDMVAEHRDTYAPFLDQKDLAAKTEELTLKQAQDIEFEAAQKKRQTLINTSRAIELDERLNEAINKGIRSDKALRVDILFTEYQGKGLAAEYSAPLEMMMEKHATAHKQFMNSPEFNESVIREIVEPGSSTDQAVIDFARLFGDTFTRLRQALNDAGKNIGKVTNEGYVPHKHNVSKIYADGFDTWFKTLDENLNWNESFPWLADVKPENVNAA